MSHSSNIFFISRADVDATRAFVKCSNFKVLIFLSSRLLLMFRTKLEQEKKLSV